MKSYGCFFSLLLLSPRLLAQTDTQLLEHWRYDAKAPLNIKQNNLPERDGVKIYDISYASPVGDRANTVGPNGDVVTAYLVLPTSAGPFPAVIYGHWCMPGSEKKNRTEFLEEAIVLARAGVASLLPDHVMVRPRFVEDSTPLNEQQIGVLVQQVVNLRRGADLLLSRADIDKTRLAYVGHSCDAAAGGILSGVDKRFKAFVLMAGNLSDEADMKRKEYEEYRQKVGAERFDAFVAKYSWTDAGKYVSHAAPATMFLQYAIDEPFLPVDLAKEHAKIVSEPKQVTFYEAQHALSPEATRDRIAFLAEQLSFKAPDAAAVATIPALVQPPWPKPSE